MRQQHDAHAPSRSAGATVALLLLLAGCSDRGTADPSPSPTASASATEGEGPIADRSHKITVWVTAEASGAAAFRWQGRQTMEVTRIGGDGKPLNVLGIGFTEPQIIPDNRAFRFRWAFDLIRTYADTPGTFTIDVTPAQPPERAISQALLIWLKVKDPAKDIARTMDEVEFLKEFTRALEPCTVQIGEGERSGSLDCPKLSTADGEVAGLRVTWGPAQTEQPTP